MRIGIIGTGRVGSALKNGLSRAGHEVRTIDRSTSPSSLEMAEWAEVVVLAVPYAALEDVAANIAPAKDKILIDCTNPIAMEVDGISFILGHATSVAEQLQLLLPDAHVVKSLNQVGAEVIADTAGFAHAPAQFIAADSAEAKKTVATLLSDLGFEPLDAGPLSKAHLLESFAVVWINQAIVQAKGRDWAFGAIPRSTRQ